jgi:hypothetical protein
VSTVDRCTSYRSSGVPSLVAAAQASATCPLPVVAVSPAGTVGTSASSILNDVVPSPLLGSNGLPARSAMTFVPEDPLVRFTVIS